MNDRIKIAIVEDLVEVALNLREEFNLDERLYCEQIYHNAEDAILGLSKNPVDIVLLDIGLPKASGIELLEIMGDINVDKENGMQFCMFTVFEDSERIFESIKAGAKGYILKHSEPEEIIKFLIELYEGGSPISPIIARKVLDAFIRLNNEKSEYQLPLTTREKELLELLSIGLMYKEISIVLGITLGTVKQHVHHIYDKLQVNNRTEAINKYYGK